MRFVFRLIVALAATASVAHSQPQSCSTSDGSLCNTVCKNLHYNSGVSTFLMVIDYWDRLLTLNNSNARESRTMMK